MQNIGKKKLEYSLSLFAIGFLRGQKNKRMNGDESADDDERTGVFLQMIYANVRYANMNNPFGSPPKEADCSKRLEKAFVWLPNHNIIDLNG